MKCPSCSAQLFEDSAFCHKCGYKVAQEEIRNVSARLDRIETELSTIAKARGPQQEYLEVDTATKAMARVQKWTTMILFFAGIPAALLLLALAVIFGRGAVSLSSIAADAQGSVNSVLDRAKREASESENTAAGALQKTKQVDESIRSTQSSVSKLSGDVSASMSKFRQLDSQADKAQAQVEILKGSVESESRRIGAISDEVRAIKTTRNMTDVLSAFPVLGEHIAGTGSGWIDPRQKMAGVLYLTLSLATAGVPKVSGANMARAIAALDENKFKVFLGYAQVYVGDPAASSQPLGRPLDADSCASWPVPGSQVPCILYFREDLRNAAFRVRDLISVAQSVPDSNIVFVDPGRLSTERRELLDLSHMDIDVVVGQQ